MDPLSISASIVALIGAARAVAVGLDKLASLRGAPAAVLQLNNEVSELRLVLDVAEPLLGKHNRAVASSGDGSALQPNLNRAKDRLTELESIISNRLMTRMGIIDRLGWLKEQDKIQSALVDIRSARLGITAMLGIVTSSTSFRIETKLEDVHSANEKGQAAISQTLASHNDSWEKALASIMAVQNSYLERLERVEASTTTEKSMSSDKQELSYTSSTLTNINSPKKSGLQSSGFETNSFSALRLRFLRQGRCSQWCDCTCHTYTRTSTPQTLQAVLGGLFIGYTGFPALTPDCVNEKCRRSSEAFLQVNYYFPSWFIARAVSIAMSVQNSKLPKFSVRVLNLRNLYDEIFQAAMVGDADTVQYLLMSGQASVKDISSDSGHSPLHCAVGGSHVEVIKILLHMGAEPFLENEHQETPYDVVSDNIFYFGGTPNATARRIDEMRGLFPSMEVVEERRRFTRIHKIVLQILHLDLEKELLKNPSLVDAKDADGRTPVSWAAARGDSKSVETLLRHGASPDTPDRIGQGPLRQALKAHNANCAKILLAYKAKVDQRDDWKQTCLLACMYYPDPVSFAVPFLEAGAQVNIKCSQGRSPIMEAVNKNNVEALKLLLSHNADVDCANNAGATPLHEGIRFNSHEALTVLLESSPVDHSLRDKRKRTILHWAAEFADIETLNILCHERLHGLNPEDQDQEHLTAIEVAENRRNEDEARGGGGGGQGGVSSEWIAAFSNLLESLMVFSTPRSALSYTGSVASEDLFMEALQHLTMEQRAELADDDDDHAQKVLEKGLS